MRVCVCQSACERGHQWFCFASLVEQRLPIRLEHDSSAHTIYHRLLFDGFVIIMFIYGAAIFDMSHVLETDTIHIKSNDIERSSCVVVKTFNIAFVSMIKTVHI